MEWITSLCGDHVTLVTTHSTYAIKIGRWFLVPPTVYELLVGRWTLGHILLIIGVLMLLKLTLCNFVPAFGACSRFRPSTHPTIVRQTEMFIHELMGQCCKRLSQRFHLRYITSEEVPTTTASYIMYQAIDIIDLYKNTSCCEYKLPEETMR